MSCCCWLISDKDGWKAVVVCEPDMREWSQPHLHHLTHTVQTVQLLWKLSDHLEKYQICYLDVFFLNKTLINHDASSEHHHHHASSQHPVMITALQSELPNVNIMTMRAWSSRSLTSHQLHSTMSAANVSTEWVIAVTAQLSNTSQRRFCGATWSA